MPVLTLLCTLFTVGLEQTVQWRYGTAGAVGLLLLSVGIKARKPAVTSAGAVVLALLMASPALSS
ncbi:MULTISPECIES: hypothetical protein [unclassified Streptomyces]|uniref:hypothetical protein n=1 Tax=unclassified Streptomyces TaxID=2593676 RepID=UPI0034543929